MRTDNAERQTVAFPVKENDEILGYFNIVQNLDDPQFAKVEANLLTWYEAGVVRTRCITSRTTGEVHLTLQVKGSIMAFYNGQTNEPVESVEQELKEGSYKLDAFSMSDDLDSLIDSL